MAAHRRCWRWVEVGRYLILTSVDAEATHAHMHTLTHVLQMCCDSNLASAVVWLRQTVWAAAPRNPLIITWHTRPPYASLQSTEPGLSLRLRLSHGSGIESVILSHQTTHTHKTFFLRLPSQFSPWNLHKCFSWGGGVAGAKDWGQEEEEASSQLHLILQGSSSFCSLKPVDSARPGIYCSRAQLHYLWLLFLFLCAHSCCNDTKSSSLLRTVTKKKAGWIHNPTYKYR